MNSKLKIAAVIIFMISACRKEPIIHNIYAEKPGQNISLTLADAKEFISQINPDSAKLLTKIRIDWKLPKNDTTKDGNKWTVVLEGQPTYQGYKQGYRELVILRDKDSRKIGAKILEIIPEAIYLQKKWKTSAEDFTGRVFEYDLNYNLTGGRLYNSGKPIGLIKQFSQQEQTTQANQGLKEINPFSGAQGKLMLYAVATCTWLQDTYIDAEGDFTVHSTKVCSTTYFDDSGSSGGGGYYDGIGGDPSGSQHGGSGGGNSSPSPPPPPSNLPGEDKSPVNPKEMMKCFSKIPSANAAFVVRVYVVEPQPGTLFNVGANSFGHVAISLSKTSGSTTITQTVGYYPTGTGLEKLSSKSQILDNGDMELDKPILLTPYRQFSNILTSKTLEQFYFRLDGVNLLRFFHFMTNFRPYFRACKPYLVFIYPNKRSF